MDPAIPTIAQGSLVAKGASPCCTVLHISSKLRTEPLKIWMFAGCLAIANYAHFLLINLPESTAVAECADNCRWWVMLAEKIWIHGAVWTCKVQTCYTSYHSSYKLDWMYDIQDGEK